LLGTDRSVALNAGTGRSRGLRLLPPPDLAAQPRQEPDLPETFEELYDQYFAFVWRSLRLMGVADEALDDASQEVFYAAYRKWPEFRGDSSLRTWIFGIVQGVAANQRRSLRRKLARLRALAEVPQLPEPSPEDLARATEQADRVLAFSDSLDEGQRVVFVLGLLEKVPAPEIAGLAGIPLNTVYSRLRKLRLSLQRWLEQPEVKDD
jgi:RNA polymerase sigma-70 factor (ECF subfamily)